MRRRGDSLWWHVLFSDPDPCVELLSQQVGLGMAQCLAHTVAGGSAYLVEHQHERGLGEKLVLANRRKQLQRIVDPIGARILFEVLCRPDARRKRSRSNSMSSLLSVGSIVAYLVERAHGCEKYYRRRCIRADECA